MRVLQLHHENQLPCSLVQEFMVLENLLLGECGSVLGDTSLQFPTIYTSPKPGISPKSVEETIGKEILQAPSAPATPACCIPLLQASSSGNSSSVVSACHCCKAIYLHTAAAEVEELCLVPQSLMMSRIFVQFVKLPIHINVSE